MELFVSHTKVSRQIVNSVQERQQKFQGVIYGAKGLHVECDCGCRFKARQSHRKTKGSNAGLGLRCSQPLCNDVTM